MAMRLTDEQQAILSGDSGEAAQRCLRTLVRFGDAMNATHLAQITHAGHFSISAPGPGVGLPASMMETLVASGLRTTYPFTVDPHPPLDFNNLLPTDQEREEFRRMYAGASDYHKGLLALGLRERDAYTCSPYVFAGGNRPPRDAVLAWSESSCVVFANSVLAARTHRNAAILDLLSNLMGVTPVFGLLTNEGRRATVHVSVDCSALPHPQLLGAVVGRLVEDGIPYVTGLADRLGPGLNPTTEDYLKEFGAAAAAIGAVGLFHIEAITPEATESGADIMLPDSPRLLVTDADIESERHDYPLRWVDGEGMPEQCLLGCPHLSLREATWWAQEILAALERHQATRLAVPTIMVAPPAVLSGLRENQVDSRLREAGVRLSATCLEDYLTNPVCGNRRVLTNSVKLRTFTTARMFPDRELVDILVTGTIPEQAS